MKKLPLYLIIGTLAIACQPADTIGTGGDANKSVTPEKKGDPPVPEKKGE